MLSERQDLNLRPLSPKPSALPKLSYFPLIDTPMISRGVVE